MYISFQHVDDDYYGKTKYIKPIIEIATQNAVYISIICEILNTYSEYSESITNTVRKAMKYAEYKVLSIEGDVIQYRKLCDKVEQFYYKGENTRHFSDGMNRHIVEHIMTEM